MINPIPHEMPQNTELTQRTISDDHPSEYSQGFLEDFLQVIKLRNPEFEVFKEEFPSLDFVHVIRLGFGKSWDEKTEWCDQSTVALKD